MVGACGPAGCPPLTGARRRGCACPPCSGLSSLISSTNLLGLFPEALFTTAQSALLPLLVDNDRLAPGGRTTLRKLMLMEPPADSDDEEDQAPQPGTWQTAASELAFSSSNGSSNGSSESMQLGFGPAAAANFRTNLLRSGDPGEAVLRSIRAPTLLLSSARDRLLPSIREGARLARLMPSARRVILPDSGHAALLERGFSMAKVLAQQDFLPPELAASSGPAYGSPSAASTSGNGSHGPRLAPQPASSQQQAEEGASSAGSNGSDSTSSSGSESAWDSWGQALAPYRDLVSPVVLGAEHIPLEQAAASGRPILFVGNHGRCGLYDLPLLMMELYLRGEPSQRQGRRQHRAALALPAAQHMPGVMLCATAGASQQPGARCLPGRVRSADPCCMRTAAGIQVKGLAHPGHWAGPLGPFFEQFGAVKASPLAAYRLLRAGEHVLLFPGGAREVNKKAGEEYM